MQNDIANEAVQSVISQFDANYDSGNDILRASILLVDADAKSLYEIASILVAKKHKVSTCLLYTSPSPRDLSTSRMPSSA